jgi:hypothetical protein
MSYPIQRYGPYGLHGDPPPVPVESVSGDTYHDKDSVIGNTVEGLTNLAKWLSENITSGAARGLAQSMGVSETTLWIGVAAVAVYLFTQKKGRR